MMPQTKPKKQRTPVGFWYVLLMCLITVLVAFGLTIGFIFRLSSSQQGDTCNVVETQQHALQAELREYDENPPTTDIGKGIQQSKRDSLAAWDRLARSLRCDEKRVGSR